MSIDQILRGAGEILDTLHSLPTHSLFRVPGCPLTRRQRGIQWALGVHSSGMSTELVRGLLSESYQAAVGQIPWRVLAVAVETHGRNNYEQHGDCFMCPL